MNLRDFVIGESFWTTSGEFRCTDIGTRVVVAVKLGPREVVTVHVVNGDPRVTSRMDEDPSWLNGPPYAVVETVFDEDDQEGCFRTQAEMITSRAAK